MPSTNAATEPQTGCPRHVAIIMDGNGRWARQHALPRLEGHRAGATAVRRVAEACLQQGVRYLTLFSFSTENWRRSEEEVQGLMALFEEIFTQHLPDLLEQDIRLRVIGDHTALPPSVREALEKDIAATAHCKSMDLILAMNYGSREEILHAARALAAKAVAGHIEPGDIDEACFAAEMWTADIPDPDLLIRSSGEMRISNFLLWQIAYAELIVSPELWPEFDAEIVERCFKEFAARERRFGMTSEQIRSEQPVGTGVLNGIPVRG